ncbi:MAG TPA: ABC transporter C-terminal domain-containing protein, partial [Rubrivivax sp.]|nr:ABC transporter C-terminal domain-containing protein [Rubrivivax sp.]
APAASAAADAASTAAAAGAAAASALPRKLSFKEQRELDELPERIDALEAEQRTIGERLAGQELYTREPQAVAALRARYAQIDDELAAAMQRWEVLASR